MSQINYPSSTLVVLNASDTATLSGNSILITDGIEAGSLSKTQLQVADVTKIMTISTNLINAYGDGAITIQNDRLYVEDVSGNVNSVSRDSGLLTTDSTGKYLSLNNTTGLNINGLAGSEGQVLSKDVSNNLTWATPEPIVSTLQYFISATNPGFQYPPVQPTATIINTYQYYGWYFINAVAGRKIAWYFPPSKNMLVSDILGLYMNFFNITTTDPQNVPFISVYTKPTGSGDAIPGFAHSVMTYSLYDGLPINPFLPVANTAYCAFMNKSGTQPNPFAYQHTIQNMLISPVPNNPRGPYLPTEEVAYIAVGSNSTSSVNQVNFVMSKVGICLATGNQEMILNPQNILSPASTWVGTATSNLNMGIYDISGAVLDNSGNTLAVGGNTTWSRYGAFRGVAGGM